MICNWGGREHRAYTLASASNHSYTECFIEPSNSSFQPRLRLIQKATETDESQDQDPCKRENLKIRGKTVPGKFAEKFPGKITGDNPAISTANPALDSVDQQSNTSTRTVRVCPGTYGCVHGEGISNKNFFKNIKFGNFWLLRGILGCHVGSFWPTWVSVQYTRSTVCVRQHQQRPWPSRHTHSTSGLSISTHISTSRGLFGRGRKKGKSGFWLMDCRSYTQDVRSTRRTPGLSGCVPCVLVHTGLRQHQQDVRSTTRRTIRPHTQESPCFSVFRHQSAGRPSVTTRRRQHTKDGPSAHAGLPWLSVCVRVSVNTHRTSLSTHRTSVSTHRTSVAVRQYTQDVRDRPSAHISACWPFLWTVR
ncbi:hypothetical protein IGI04_043122, partial [Brassica rapa subsp. trilocularis]